MSADNENMVNSNQFMYIIKEFYSQRQNQVLQWQYIPSNYPSHIIVNPNNIIATFSVKVQDNYSDNKIPLYSNVPRAVCTVWIIIGIVWTCDFHVSHVSKIPSTWPYHKQLFSHYYHYIPINFPILILLILQSVIRFSRSNTLVFQIHIPTLKLVT